MTQDKLSEELLPCPFCGGAMRNDHDHLRHVEQGKCPIGAYAWGNHDAVEKWNTRALRSATPMPGVKPLEWDEVTQARSDEDPHREVVGWECSTGFDGFYIVEITGGGASLTTTNYDCTYYGSPDEAKAAAQADYEARIRSALTTPPTREVSEAEVERAALRSYQYEGDKRGIDYAGWDMEPEGVKEEWRASCRVVLNAVRSLS